MNEHWSGLEQSMRQQGIQTLLITDPKHVYYLTGFLSNPHERFLGILFQPGNEPILVAPALDEEAARAATGNMEIITHLDTDNPYLLLKNKLHAPVGTVGLEKENLTVARFEQLQESLGFTTYHDVGPWLRDMRVRKTAGEIGKIRHAVRLIEEVLQESLKQVKEGVSENELVAEVEYQIRKLGADGPSFDSMVLSGEKTALPHGVPGERKLRRGDMLMFDIGVYASGYASDITRTFAFGELTEEQIRIYETVLAANEAAIAAIRPGVTYASIDKAARDVIENAGYGQYFIHRLGHGLGIDVHEFPSVHGQNEYLLSEGNVFTVEPGIYVPGVGGVRIEDDCLVTDTGVEVLTSFPKQLTYL
ncbi:MULTISPECIES: M24 family metallopeptidase [Paenibacillus]|uniref:Xaa-Pro dipeptidase n=1 Tax=Paenibacillus vini TaxID=1476024 RepID=A0ABQ4MFV9_9BACL|nr:MULTISPECIES: Xaa-Pro peptidase family protein [Paenibacillus]MBQ4899453.1 aminopeptidase P family protein [Paenibacillus sp. Marseille-P2973]MDN4068492.1 Xaa-Pro peptidase family protein [Paenibacillus vini]GIP54884.1 Xaa-Pro dipeptidase [Paenibacillus vini]